MNDMHVIIRCPSCRAKNKVPLSRIDDQPVCGKCKVPLPVDTLSRTVDVTDQNFNQEVLASTLPVLVDCWAPWCGPCRSFAPVLDDLAKKYKARLKIAKLNVDENPVTGSRYAVSSVPTLLLVKNGNIVDKLTGALPKEQLERQIGRIL
ncbi:MAG: thioredoxin TrxC [Proteobacteria bacterium]|nr:thioredoxin TrxC [Pseudomonadota bacterium]MBU1387633.1 thioredoxin TrxC [Pseudomonadota bacterium]MBU1544224.1 thioredoxin TrxC [Pseudomonadota bacterium]MBU2430788.1 thioredoxin TrxC [Pseudomonadota bacterium]